MKRIKINKWDEIRFWVDDIHVSNPTDTFNCCSRCLLYSHYFDQTFKTGETYPLPGVHFKWNDTTLAEGCYPDLEAVKQLLEHFPQWKARIIGHTDSTGDLKYNQLLSEGRARAVRDFLVRQGIAAARLEAAGKGASVPVAPNSTEEGRAQNRRVEVIFEE